MSRQFYVSAASDNSDALRHKTPVNYDDCKLLAEGASGGVRYFPNNNVKHVFKTFHKPQDSRDLDNTLTILKHPALLYEKVRTVASVPLAQVVENLGVGQYRPFGYVMEFLAGWEPLVSIMNGQCSVSFREIALIFNALHKALSLIHSLGFVVGDLSDQNILLRRTANGLYEVKVIDVDSWSISLPSAGLSHQSPFMPHDACHPDFLAGRTPMPQHKTEHDWWTFTYHLYGALVKYDPFLAGLIADFDTLPKRISNGITITHPGLLEIDPVELGAAKSMGPTLLRTIDAFLKCKESGVFPRLLLAHLYQSATTCKKCGKDVHREAGTCPRQQCGGALS